VVKVIWHKTASPPQTHGSIVFARWRQCAHRGGHIGATWRIRLNLCFLQHTWVHSPNGKRSVQLFLHSSRQKVLILYNGGQFPPKLPLLVGGDGTPIYFMISWGRPSPQSKLHHNRFSYFRTGDCRVSLYFTMGAPFPENCPFPRSGPQCKTRFFGPIRAHIPNGISTGSAVFAQMTAECPYALQWDAPFPLQNCPFPWGDMDPHLIHGSLGPPKSSTQMASRSVQQI